MAFQYSVRRNGSPHKALSDAHSRKMLVWKKSACIIFELPLASTDTTFTRQMTDTKFKLSRLGYLADIFPKMNKVKLSFREKQLTIFTGNDKIPSKY